MSVDIDTAGTPNTAAHCWITKSVSLRCRRSGVSACSRLTKPDIDTAVSAASILRRVGPAANWLNAEA